MSACKKALSTWPESRRTVRARYSSMEMARSGRRANTASRCCRFTEISSHGVTATAEETVTAGQEGRLADELPAVVEGQGALVPGRGS